MSNKIKTPSISELISLKEAIELLHVARATIYRWFKLKRLTKYKILNRVAILRTQCEAIALPYAC